MTDVMHRIYHSGFLYRNGIGVADMAKKADKNIRFRRLSGIVCMSMGLGMILVLLIPGWGYLAAAFLAIIGFWNLFF